MKLGTNSSGLPSTFDLNDNSLFKVFMEVTGPHFNQVLMWNKCPDFETVAYNSTMAYCLNKTKSWPVQSSLISGTTVISLKVMRCDKLDEFWFGDQQECSSEDDVSEFVQLQNLTILLRNKNVKLDKYELAFKSVFTQQTNFSHSLPNGLQQLDFFELYSVINWLFSIPVFEFSFESIPLVGSFQNHIVKMHPSTINLHDLFLAPPFLGPTSTNYNFVRFELEPESESEHEKNLLLNLDMRFENR